MDLNICPAIPPYMDVVLLSTPVQFWTHHPSITGPEPAGADPDVTRVQNQSKPGPASLRVGLKRSGLIQDFSLVAFDGGLGALLLIHVGLLVAGEAG